MLHTPTNEQQRVAPTNGQQHVAPTNEQQRVAPTNEQQCVDAENARLREELERLGAEVARLRSENRHLRATLDAHIARANSPSLYGPLELTAGTCVGPRRRRGARSDRRA